MTAQILQFPDRHRGSEWQARKPGELDSHHLRLTGRHWPSAAMRARAYALYLGGPPCWKHPVCVDRAGHAGKCRMPGSKSSPPCAQMEPAE